MVMELSWLSMCRCSPVCCEGKRLVSVGHRYVGVDKDEVSHEEAEEHEEAIQDEVQ